MCIRDSACALLGVDEEDRASIRTRADRRAAASLPPSRVAGSSRCQVQQRASPPVPPLPTSGTKRSWRRAALD
eukprot:3859336-Alexandrium_andersonii.AAC.1